MCPPASEYRPLEDVSDDVFADAEARARHDRATESAAKELLQHATGSLLILGLMLGFAVPALRHLSNSQGLKGAQQNMVAQLQLARARAMSTGTDQIMHFFPGTYGYDYHLHTGNPVGWNFPQGVTYQRAADFKKKMLTDGSGNPVPISIDPFYFSVAVIP